MRFVRCISLLALLWGLALGCGIPGPAAAASSDVMLQFPSWQVTDPVFGDWWRALIAEFEDQHPNVRINFYHVPYASYEQHLVTRFASGNPPDIVHLPTASFIRFAREPGWLEPLDDRLRGTDIPHNWTTLQSELVYKGRTMGLLLLAVPFVLAYNNTPFINAGVQVPRSWDELVEVARRLTRDRNGDGRADQFGIGLVTVQHPDVYDETTVLLFDSGRHWVADNASLDRDAVASALDKVRRLVSAGLTPLGLDSNRRDQLWEQGDVAMIFEGAFIQGRIAEASRRGNDALAVARLPFRDVYARTSNALAIPEGISQEKKELVWKFMQLAASPRWQREYARRVGVPPPRQGVLSANDLASMSNVGLFVQELARARNGIPPGLGEAFPEFRDRAINGVLRYALGGAPLQNVLDELEQHLRHIISGARK